MQQHFDKIAKELTVRVAQVQATVELLEKDATVPFISRYRKEATGSLDEVQITAIRDRILQLKELDKRRLAILKSLEEQGKLTDALKKSVDEAETLVSLEDIYLPFRPKRKTRASIAKEKGLEPLGKELFEQSNFDILAKANEFVSEEKGVKNVDEALAGARDIMAEWINEDAEVRSKMRTLFTKHGTITAKVISGKEEEGKKYKDYFDVVESIENAPSHRVLAMRRAEKEMIISLNMTPEEEEAIELLERQFVTADNSAGEQVALAIKDTYKRLLRPSMETETRLLSKKRADQEAITVFADNLRELLLAAPMGQKRTLGLDPGFRTGCKVVCLDRQGQLVYDTAIYPNEPQKQVQQSAATIAALCQKYEIEAIAIGNGTAGRETERFIKDMGLPSKIQVIMVNESGASVYSASKVAREEFPDHDLTVRGSVSIARRLMDPLAELVKLDPKSIGVGQYQHDVEQKALKNSLDDVVVSCVNAVGVEVNTASRNLLSYVSGLGDSLAKNIIDYRNENGAFTSRTQLKKVPRLGAKAYEQAAGFLRIRDGKNPLDASAVHPESYTVVKQMAKDLNCTVEALIKEDNLRKQLNLRSYVSETIGLPTLEDIIKELAKPGRDPREQFESFEFQEGVNSMEDVRIGMTLPGIVTNVTDFGAFIDIGVHQDGLAHISQLSDRFIKHPSEAVKVQQKVQATVLEVDVDRKRISLSLKANPNVEPSLRGKSKSIRTPKKVNDENLSMEDKLAKLKNMWKR
jgi:uncharacterized protein